MNILIIKYFMKIDLIQLVSELTRNNFPFFWAFVWILSTESYCYILDGFYQLILFSSAYSGCLFYGSMLWVYTENSWSWILESC
jgi:hypothetical protein